MLPLLLIPSLLNAEQISSLPNACGDVLELGLAVEGAYTKNSTNYTVNVNEHAVFTCTARVTALRELPKVESTVVVRCLGSQEEVIKSSGHGNASARYQTNRNCGFNTQCTVQCLAKEECELEGQEGAAYNQSQPVNLLKGNDGAITAEAINCTDMKNTYCHNSTTHIHKVQRTGYKNLTGVELSGDTSCVLLQHWNTSMFYVMYVLPSQELCTCSSTFECREVNSEGEMCQTPVFREVLELRNETNCIISDEFIASVVVGGFAGIIFVVTLAMILVNCYQKRLSVFKILGPPKPDPVEELES